MFFGGLLPKGNSASTEAWLWDGKALRRSAIEAPAEYDGCCHFHPELESVFLVATRAPFGKRDDKSAGRTSQFDGKAWRSFRTDDKAWTVKGLLHDDKTRHLVLCRAKRDGGYELASYGGDGGGRSSLGSRDRTVLDALPKPDAKVVSPGAKKAGGKKGVTAAEAEGGQVPCR